MAGPGEPEKRECPEQREEAESLPAAPGTPGCVKTGDATVPRSAGIAAKIENGLRLNVGFNGNHCDNNGHNDNEQSACK